MLRCYLVLFISNSLLSNVKHQSLKRHGTPRFLGLKLTIKALDKVYYIALQNFRELLVMEPSDLAQPAEAIIEPMARSTCEVGSIPFRVFLGCSQIQTIPIAVLLLLNELCNCQIQPFFLFIYPPLRALSPSWRLGNPQARACQEQSEATLQIPLRSLQINSRRWCPPPIPPNAIWEQFLRWGCFSLKIQLLSRWHRLILVKDETPHISYF